MSNYPNVELRGLMAMASFTSNQEQIISEFSKAASTAKKLANIIGIARPVISMGMSGDWPIAIQCGSNMIRIGTAIFGGR
jgi:PLP dependent protein